MDEARRRFLRSIEAGLVCAGALGLAGRAGESAAAAPPRPSLSLPQDRLRASYDVVVVGSGYGGAIAAARLAPGRSLCVLERGNEWQPAAFPHRLTDVLAQFRSDANPLGLFDYRAGADLDVLVGNGLGGTSLINANVVIAPERDVMAQAAWPAAIRNAYATGAMDRHEATVRQMLGVARIGDTHELRKHWLHRSSTRRRARAGAAVTFAPLDLAVNLATTGAAPNAQGVWQSPCTHCGDCVSGCRVGAKNTLDVNYLPFARQRGAELHTGFEVRRVERLADGRWRVHYTARSALFGTRQGAIVATHVVLAAGALGSTEILLRSRDAGLRVSSALGLRFSANGDLLGLGYNTDVQANVAGYGDAPPRDGAARVGPTITSAARYANTSIPQRYLIEEGALPSALVDALRLALPAGAGLPPTFQHERRIASDIAALRSHGAVNHSMVYLGIGHDSAGGRLRLGTDQRLALSWPGVMNEPFVARIRAEMARHAQAFAGRHVDSPRKHPLFGAAMTTVHPLGGCAMADAPSSGTVDADCRVYDGDGGAVHRGLYVMDGAVVSTSLGVNPLLTIAALAERATERFVG